MANNEGSQNSAGQTSNKGKGKKKKWKNNTQEDTEKTTPPLNQQGKSSSNSNKKGDTNKEKKKCAYCKKLGHDEHECYHKKIDELTNIIKKHNVPLPNAYKEKGSSSSDSKGKGQALMENSSSLAEWILDSRASYHMGSSKGDFSSLKQSKVPHIFVGDNTKMEVEGKGYVEMENEEFKDILYLPRP